MADDQGARLGEDQPLSRGERPLGGDRSQAASGESPSGQASGVGGPASSGYEVSSPAFFLDRAVDPCGVRAAS
jgi:hypothetical protein